MGASRNTNEAAAQKPDQAKETIHLGVEYGHQCQPQIPRDAECEMQINTW